MGTLSLVESETRFARSVRAELAIAAPFFIPIPNARVFHRGSTGELKLLTSPEISSNRATIFPPLIVKGVEICRSGTGLIFSILPRQTQLDHFTSFPSRLLSP